MTFIELAWTISPTFILLAIANPSFNLLYLLDEVIAPSLTLKVLGFLPDGLKLYILNKIIDTKLKIGKKNNLKRNYINLIYYSKYNNFSINLIPLKKINNITKIEYLNKNYFHTHSRSINRIGPHNLDIISVIVGSLLGDGYAENRTGEGVRLKFKQSIIHKEYLFYLYHFFYSRGYCSNLEPKKYTRTIKNKEKIYYGYEFNTYTFRSLN